MSTTPMSKVWLITGSSRGFGRSLAEAVLEHGDRLVATARHPQQLSDLVTRYGAQVRAVPLDVTNAEQARAAVAAAVEAFGRLDVVVNNAGYRYYAAIEDANEAELRAEMETDLWGVVNVTRAALPILHHQRSGHIVQFSSIEGRMGAAGMGAYNMAKWAVEGFSEALAQEVAPLGIKVTIIEPGAFRTEYSAAARETKETPPSADYQGAVAHLVSPGLATSRVTPPKQLRRSSPSRAKSSRRCDCCWAATPFSWPARSTRPISPRSPAGSS